MLGDAGANALGALLGVALAARTGAGRPGVALAVLAGLTAASEKVSFTKVIQDTPWLRELDELGRRPPTGVTTASPAAGPARIAGAAALITVLTVVARIAGFGRTFVFLHTGRRRRRPGQHLQRRQHHPEHRLRAGRRRRAGQPRGAAAGRRGRGRRPRAGRRRSRRRC